MMGKGNMADFFSTCLGYEVTNNNTQINTVFRKYDKDRDKYLMEHEFL